MPVSRDLADALIEVVRERMTEQGYSVNRLAGEVGLNQATLSRQLKGQGHLTVDEFEALSQALGEDLAALVVAARRRL